MGCTHSTARSADVITIPYDGETRCSKVMALAAACASVRLSSSVVACERLPCDDALLRAAAAGDEARVEAALLAGANPNCKALPVRRRRKSEADTRGDPTGVDPPLPIEYSRTSSPNLSRAWCLALRRYWRSRRPLGRRSSAA